MKGVDAKVLQYSERLGYFKASCIHNNLERCSVMLLLFITKMLLFENFKLLCTLVMSYLNTSGNKLYIIIIIIIIPIHSSIHLTSHVVFISFLL